MASLFHNKLVLALGFVLLIVIGWYVLSGQSSPAPTLVRTSANSNAPGEQLVSTLLTLRAVTLSGTIFSDPVFQSLKDFSTQIVPEPVGRTDPFAPVASSTAPGVNDSGNAASKNTKLFAPKTP